MLGRFVGGSFWSSDILTGNQTIPFFTPFKRLFWSSDILTGNQTEGYGIACDELFWSSDILTGNQTRTTSPSTPTSFGAVTF